MLPSMPANFSFTPHALGGRLPTDVTLVHRRRHEQKPSVTDTGGTCFFPHSRYAPGFADLSGRQKAAVV
jgi:hypothetical protein